MKNQDQNQVALVTGGASGIGQALCIAAKFRPTLHPNSNTDCTLFTLTMLAIKGVLNLATVRFFL